MRVIVLKTKDDFMNRKKTILRVLTYTLGAMMAFLISTVDTYAKEGNVLPSAGIDFVLSNTGVSVKKVKEEVKAKAESKSNKDTKTSAKADTKVSNTATAVNPSKNDDKKLEDNAVAEGNDTSVEETNEEANDTEEKVVEETMEAVSSQSVKETERAIDAKKEEEGFKNLVIAKCDSWVNVREDATTDSKIVGKLYNKSAGEYLEEKDGWYKISSGSCTGYVSAEYCVTGEDAVDLAKEVGTRVCTVDTTTLYVRAETSTDSACLGMVPLGEVLTVSEELDGWAKVNIEEGDGYVSLDYVKLSTEFIKAESKEEEEARLAKERQARQEALEAARAAALEAQANNNNNNNNTDPGDDGTNQPAEKPKQQIYATGGGSELGIQVANYALQFNGNPYVYGGTSLTNGADCSGFVLAVYKHFGVSLPHSANADRKMGYAVDGIENAQPGDLMCYSGHVGIYIGDNKIIHASTTKTGIKISNANYRSVLAIRRIF